MNGLKNTEGAKLMTQRVFKTAVKESIPTEFNSEINRINTGILIIQPPVQVCKNSPQQICYLVAEITIFSNYSSPNLQMQWTSNKQAYSQALHCISSLIRAYNFKKIREQLKNLG
jgi:hypothetical protein